MSDHFILFDPNGPDLEFNGERIIDQRYAAKGHWRIYKTVAGKYVLEHKQAASRLGKAAHQVIVFEGFKELSDELSKSWEGKDILERLGQPNRRFIE